MSQVTLDSVTIAEGAGEETEATLYPLSLQAWRQCRGQLWRGHGQLEKTLGHAAIVSTAIGLIEGATGGAGLLE